MIERIVKDYLAVQLDVPVYMETPDDKPLKYVVVEKGGSGGADHINTAVIMLKSHADTLADAATLNEEVKSAMDNIITLAEITRSDRNSDYNYTDTSTRKYRYQAVYDLTHY